MKKFWIIFVSLLLCAVVGVGIWHGIAYGDKIKVFAEETWQKIESAFKKEDEIGDDFSDSNIFDESSLNGVYLCKGYRVTDYFSLQGMESEEPMFMYLHAFYSGDCVYLCEKYKSDDMHRNVYCSLVKEYDEYCIKYYLDDSLLLCYDKKSGTFVDCESDWVPVKKFVSVKTAHELTPQVVVSDNLVSLKNDFAFCCVKYYYRLSGEEQWNYTLNCDFDELFKAGDISIGDTCEVKVLCEFNCCHTRIESDDVEFVFVDPHTADMCQYDWDIIKAATCCEEGYKIGTCDICGDVVESIIPVGKHSYVLEPVEGGLSGQYNSVCSTCGYVLPQGPILSVDTTTIRINNSEVA